LSGVCARGLPAALAGQGLGPGTQALPRGAA